MIWIKTLKNKEINMKKKSFFRGVLSLFALTSLTAFAETKRQEGVASASSFAPGMEAGKAFDGNPESQWRAASGNFPQTLIRSFPNTITANKIETIFPEYYAYEYAIYASNKDLPSKNLEDKDSWTKVAGPKIASGEVTDEFKPVKAKHFATKFYGLLSNSSFENPAKDNENFVATEWQKHIRDGGTQELDTNIAHSGKVSVKLTDKDLKDGKGFHLYHKLIPVKPNSTYAYSVYAKAEEGKTAQVGIRLDQMTADKKWAQFETNQEATKRTKWGPFPIASSKWKKFTFVARTAPDCEYLRPGIFYYNNPKVATNVFWIDDVFLIEGEEETDIAGISEQKIYTIKGE
jgi:hypothetical protein